VYSSQGSLDSLEHHQQVFLQSNFSRLLGVYGTSPASLGDEYSGESRGGDTTGDLDYMLVNTSIGLASCVMNTSGC
jgi:hypothetical protein